MILLALFGMIATPPAAMADGRATGPAFGRPRAGLHVSADFRARRPGKRYSVTVPIGKAKPSVALPRIEGPADGRLPLVVIDAGHGGHDPGAISPHGGKREKDITLAIARAIRSDLIASGRARVALTRADDRFLVLEERYGIARRLKADLFISVHADAAENREASGASIYTLSEVASDREAARLAARENRANIINGIDLGAHGGDVSAILLDLAQRETMNVASDFARLLRREASDEVKFRTTAHRFASFIVLKAPDTPSVLFETGFLSNKDDAEFLASPAGQKKVARGVRDAVQVHFARRIAALGR
ncbi:MAG: N-acetylmuramoyl-L-alanine amidase [Sphingopyxis sp.]|nr:N-acetylmuramoyl-L-alanine amidase [Sphingopyxis sp.]